MLTFQSGCHPRPRRLPTAENKSIHLAAREGDLKTLGRLIEAGVSVNAGDDSSEGDTPLIEAAGNDQIRAVKFLLQRGADPFQRNEYGSMPFDAAVGGGSERVAELLFNVQTERDSDYFGTVLHGAVILGEKELVIEELKKGSDVHKRNHRGQTPLDNAFAGYIGSARMARLILKRRKGISPGPWTPGKNRMEIIKILVSNGADPNALNRTWNAVQRAVSGGYLDILKYLLENGGDIHSGLLIERAAHGGQAEVMRFLIGKGLESEPKNLYPLQTAAYQGHQACVEVLLAAGANPMRKDHWGRTALDRAQDRLKSAKKNEQIYGGSFPNHELVEKNKQEQIRFAAIVDILSQANRGR